IAHCCADGVQADVRSNRCGPFPCKATTGPQAREALSQGPRVLLGHRRPAEMTTPWVVPIPGAESLVALRRACIKSLQHDVTKHIRARATGVFQTQRATKAAIYPGSSLSGLRRLPG